MARLYADENFPFPTVKALRELEHDVATMIETGHAEQAIPDDKVLDLAASDNRTLLTINRRRFIRLHGIRPDHAGIIVCSFDPDFLALAQQIHDCIAAHPRLEGQLIRVNRPDR